MKPEPTTATPVQGEYQLRVNRPLRLLHAAGRKIVCLSGTAWITSYGQSTDFLLRAGQSFQVPNDGLTLVEAIGHGSIELAAPPPGRATPGASLRRWLNDYRRRNTG
jgi:hypothetical protein